MQSKIMVVHCDFHKPTLTPNCSHGLIMLILHFFIAVIQANIYFVKVKFIHFIFAVFCFMFVKCESVFVFALTMNYDAAYF